MQCVVEPAEPATGVLESRPEPKNRRRRQPYSDKVFAAKTTDEIMAVMKADDKAAERARILEKMNSACREKYEYIRTWFSREMDHMLRSRYELGLHVQELYEDERKNAGKVYGRNAVGRICKLLEWDDGVIRAALRFVKTFSPDDLDRICALVLPTGEPLTCSHIRTLLHVDDAKSRRALLDRTVEEGWTCTELAWQIKISNDGRTVDGRGRPPKTPKDFDGAVAQQQESAEKWERQYIRVWAVPDRSLVAQAAKLPAEEVTEKRLSQARRLAHHLRQVADHAVKQAEQAENVVQEFEQILTDRKPKGETPEPVVAGSVTTD
jgi:hypothetical protein